MIQHRNTEVLAAQEKIDKLNGQFAAETERLRKEQLAALTSIRKPIEIEIQKLESKSAELHEHIAKRNSEAELLDKTIPDLQNTIQTKQDNLSELKSEILAYMARTEQINDTNIAINDTKIALELRVSELNTEEIRLKEAIAGLNKDFGTQKVRIETVEKEYTAKIADREKTLKLLDAKILKSRQELEAREQEETITREDFAKRERILEQRDKNLRIREAKIGQGESKLIQNANLMNL